MSYDRFQEIAEQMQQALDNEDASLFSSLTRKRSKMIHHLFDENSPPPPGELLEKLTEENKRWLVGAQQFLKQTQAKIDKLKPTKTATRHLSATYAAHNSGTGNLLSQKG